MNAIGSINGKPYGFREVEAKELTLDWSYNSRHQSTAGVLSLAESIEADGGIQEPILAAEVKGRKGLFVLRGFRRVSAILELEKRKVHFTIPARIILAPIDPKEVAFLVADTHKSGELVGLFRLTVACFRNGVGESDTIIRNLDAFNAASKQAVKLEKKLSETASLSERRTACVNFHRGRIQTFSRVYALGPKAVFAYEGKLLGEKRLDLTAARLDEMAKLAGREREDAIDAWTTEQPTAAGKRPSLKKLADGVQSLELKGLFAFLTSVEGKVTYYLADLDATLLQMEHCGFDHKTARLLFEKNRPVEKPNEARKAANNKK